MIVRKPLKIIVDTREQQPLEFLADKRDNEIILGRDKLDCGDYSLYGHDRPKDDHSIIIERKKDCSELAINLGSKWEQFENELRLLTHYRHRAILVCAPNNFEWLYDKKYTMMKPEFIMKRMSEVHINYGVPIIFLNNREMVETYMIRLFKRVLENVQE